MLEKVKNNIHSYNKGSFAKRFLIMVLATVLMNLGIAFYYQCLLGTDPFSVFVDGEHSIMNLTYGQVTNINNVFLFAFMLICGRNKIHVGTLFCTIFSGMLIDLFNLIINKLFPPTSVAGQAALLTAGLVIFAVGVALYIIADLGIGAVEYMAILVSEKTKINLRWIRIAQDVIFMLIGVLLGWLAGRQIFGDLIGIGTIVGAFGTGVIMKWFMNRTSEAFEKWFGPLRNIRAPKAAE